MIRSRWKRTGQPGLEDELCGKTGSTERTPTHVNSYLTEQAIEHVSSCSPERYLRDGAYVTSRCFQGRHTAPDVPFGRELIRMRAGESQAYRLSPSQQHEAKERRKAGEVNTSEAGGAIASAL